MKMKIRGEVYYKLNSVAKLMKLSKTTIINIALYDGIRSVAKGVVFYFPKKKVKNKKTVKFNITDNLERDIEVCAQTLKYSRRVIMETFIDAECGQILNEYKIFKGKDAVEDLPFTEVEYATQKVNVSLHPDINKCIDRNLEIMGLKWKRHYYSYLITMGFLFQERSYLMFTSDKNMLIAEGIARLNLQAINAINFADFLYKNGNMSTETLDKEKILKNYIELYRLYEDREKNKK